MGKLSALPSNTTPLLTDTFVSVQGSGPTDVQVTLANMALAISPAWTSFTPAYTSGVTIGNGINQGNYIQIGKTVIFRIHFKLGSTSAIGANPIFTPPVPASTFYTNASTAFDPIGNAWYNTSSTQCTGVIVFDAGDNTKIQLIYSPSTTTVAGLSATTPGTWATGGYFSVTGTYEAA